MKQIYLTLAAAAMMMPCAAGAQSLVAEPVSGAQGETVTMTVGLDNPGIEIVSIDCNILFPKGVTAASVDGIPTVELTDRKVDHVTASSILPTGYYKVVVYSNSNRAFEGESGAVFTMPLELNAEPGEYTVIVNEIVINAKSTGDPEKVNNCDDMTFPLTITEAKEPEVDRHVDNQFFCPDITINEGEDATFRLFYDSTAIVYSYACDVALPSGVGMANIAFDDAIDALNFTNDFNWDAKTGTLKIRGEQPRRGDTLPEGKNLLLTATLSTGELTAGEYSITLDNQSLENKDSDDSFTPEAYVVNLVVKSNATPSVMELIDGTPYTNSTDYNNIDVTYTRNFEHQEWQPLYIPFNMSYEEWCDKAEVARINDVHQFDRNGDGDFDDAGVDETIIEFIIVKEGEIRPNTPYVIRPKQTGDVTFECTGKTLTAAPAQDGSVWCASTQVKYTLTGTYQPKNDMSGLYAMRNGSFWLANASSPALSPYRFYLSMENVDNGYGAPATPLPAPAMMKIMVNDEDTPTGVDSMTAYPEDGVVYDLMGRRVENPTKGLYIINGKKVVVK